MYIFFIDVPSAMEYLRVSVTVLILGVLLWFLYQYLVSSPLLGKDFQDEYDFIVSEYLKGFISIDSF